MDTLILSVLRQQCLGPAPTAQQTNKFIVRDSLSSRPVCLFIKHTIQPLPTTPSTQITKLYPPKRPDTSAPHTRIQPEASHCSLGHTGHVTPNLAHGARFSFPGRPPWSSRQARFPQPHLILIPANSVTMGLPRRCLYSVKAKSGVCLFARIRHLQRDPEALMRSLSWSPIRTWDLNLAGHEASRSRWDAGQAHFRMQKPATCPLARKCAPLEHPPIVTRSHRSHRFIDAKCRTSITHAFPRVHY